MRTSARGPETSSAPEAPWWTSAYLALAFLGIAAIWFFASRHRILWSDEIFGWVVVTDPRWRHALLAWQQGADGGGAGFYLLCRLWLHTFGQTYLSFRAFSAFGCFVGLSATFFTLRRFYDTWSAALALTLVWFGSDVILWQVVQTRFYGMLLGAAALVLLLAVRRPGAASAGTLHARAWLLGVVAANALLVEVHPFGVLYSAVIFASALLSDGVAGSYRPRFYVATVAPWVLLLYSRQAMVNSAKVGKPWFWTLRPSKWDLLNFYTPSFLAGWLWLLVGIGLVVLLVGRRAARQGLQERQAILLPGLVLMFVPIPIFLVSHFGPTSYMVDRYLIPTELGVAILGAEALTALKALVPHGRARRFTMGGLAVVLLSTALVQALFYARNLVVPPLDFTPRLGALLPSGVPVVVERVDVFTVLMQQAHDAKVPYVYLLDWPNALDPANPRGQVSGFHEMENWKRLGYFAEAIRPASEFLATQDRFVVLQYADMHWFDRRILHHPEWQSVRVAEFKDGFWTATVWLVSRTANAAAAVGDAAPNAAN